MARIKRICSVQDCGKPHSSRGYCKTHAARDRKYGDPNKLLKVRRRGCSVDGCDRKHDSHGFCGAHVWRLRRHGDPLGGGTAHGAPFDFLVNVAAHHEGGECLAWPYGRTTDGHPQIHVGDTTRSACRVLCELVYGEPPSPDYEAAHNCGKGHEGCISKAHLRWATKDDNETDKVLHGTLPYGEKVATSKLTQSEVEEIRALRGKASQAAIAARYGISQSAVCLIQTGKNWRHLDPISPGTAFP